MGGAAGRRRSGAGRRTAIVVDVATLFLTGRECPWRCVMCDLWRDTLETDTPPGAIPHQIELRCAWHARGAPGRCRADVKLYNAGSFFDDRAVPPDDDAAIARPSPACRA